MRSEGLEPRFTPLSTRLFPKGNGAHTYELTGIASRCDWVLLSDRRPPHTHWLNLAGTDQPRTIFVSLRGRHAAIRSFVSELLPVLKSPFILITGSGDITIPSQTDLRWRPYNAAERAAISSILEHPLLVRWHAENLDDAAHPKLHPLPLGLVFPDGAPERGVPIPETPSLSIRDNRVLCAHRIRDGAQWAQRVQATTLAKQQWRAWTTVLEEEIGEAEFDDLLREHAFVLCVAGGGLDPSPKAWRALLNGAIPIIRRSPLLDAYSRLPVVVVDDWAEGCITPARLRAWKTHYELGAMRPNNRGALIEKLSLDYWWDVIVTDR